MPLISVREVSHERVRPHKLKLPSVWEAERALKTWGGEGETAIEEEGGEGEVGRTRGEGGRVRWEGGRKVHRTRADV